MQKSKKTVVIGFLGSTLDQGRSPERWKKWRPSLSLLMQDDLVVDEMILLHDRTAKRLFDTITDDAKAISPYTQVCGHQVSIRDPWDFAEMYGLLYDFIKSYNFDTDVYDYFLHITTGTHVAQICWYLLIEAHYLPARLIQTSPKGKKDAEGTYRIIDLDLSRYSALSQRFEDEKTENWQKLKAHISTQNQRFNQLIQEVELVATRSNAPILIMGATGVGKSQLAKQIYQLKKEHFHLEGQLVDVNCATLLGDSAMSSLFGHNKGAFTGAINARAGYLKSADQGILFLDEIGELGLDEQAMLLKALEDKAFYPVGSDKEVQVEFQLIAGTNKDLREEVQAGRFREDLWARLNTWTFILPTLKDRIEDLEPNLEFELEKFALQHQRKIRFHRDALERYLKFAQSVDASWQGNFRDLTASVTRMATLAHSERIGLNDVDAEIERLKKLWHINKNNHSKLLCILSAKQFSQLDEFDRIQLEGVVEICLKAKSMAEAGRILFSQSRQQRQSTNDSDRVKKYLSKFDLSWDDLQNLK